jgi:2-dehydropantoate 2-reductase
MSSNTKNIAIYGLGSIGTTYAYKLAKSNHQITCIARGDRYKQLIQDNGKITTENNDVVKVFAVHDHLDETISYDLILVTVLQHQVMDILPMLVRSKAKNIQFMFNTFDVLFDELRDAVGSDRFSFGFPVILASFIDNGKKLKCSIVTFPMSSISTSRDWAITFTNAGIKTSLEVNMKSWLCTHAIVVIPVMCLVWIAHVRHAGVSWQEAQLGVETLHEGFHLLELMKYPVTPWGLNIVKYLPTFILVFIFWILTRISTIRDSSAARDVEPRNLIKVWQHIGRSKFGIEFKALNELGERL